MSTIVTDTITGKSTATTVTIGSTPVVSASANSLTIRGEGSNQTSIQQGLDKVFINFNGTGTIATRDSFNSSSIVDAGTGHYRVVFTNSMGNVNYTHILNCNHTSSFNGMFGSVDTGGVANTSQSEFFTCSAHTTNNDSRTVHATVLGDLA